MLCVYWNDQRLSIAEVMSNMSNIGIFTSATGGYKSQELSRNADRCCSPRSSGKFAFIAEITGPLAFSTNLLWSLQMIFPLQCHNFAFFMRVARCMDRNTCCYWELSLVCSHLSDFICQIPKINPDLSIVDLVLLTDPRLISRKVYILTSASGHPIRA